MNYNKKSIKKLRDELPWGSAVQIRKRILEKHGIEFTIQYINAVLDPDDFRMNRIILEEAIAYRDEKKAEVIELEKRILTNP